GDNGGVGAAWVFVRSAGVWSQQGSKWTVSGASGAPSLGVSAALSADGNTAVVGGSSDNGGLGAAWVFIRNGSAWSQQGSKLVGTGAVGAANQGSSVSITSDGNTVLVGGEGDNSGAGAAWVFTRTGGVWAQNGSKIVGSGASNPAHQGKAVAISADGYTAAVGGNTDNSGGGAAWMFTRSTLPIQLSTFSAQVSTGGEVRLEWTTLSETDNYGFQVERSGGGAGPYASLPGGFLPGHGTTLEEHSYKYTDVPPSRGVWRYRLKQVDLDGAVTYGESREVEIAGGAERLPGDFLLAQNYPDPFNPSTTIGIALPREAFVTVDVYNALGQKVAQLAREVMQAGYHDLVFDATGLASGAYLYRMTAGSFVCTRRSLLIR
ncbi:MAG TPA: T9SS type A sorting domain-containing protein, partial [Bacteroidota bacterium]|nr:T9SS type A sorting domain-containing protein [Bacteroidota bacterium]